MSRTKRNWEKTTGRWVCSTLHLRAESKQIRGYDTLIDVVDMNTGIQYSVSEFNSIAEFGADEEEQPLLVPRFERPESPPVLQRRSTGIQSGTPPKQ